jgi:tetratricopeptide (TPR) repeat protein
MRELSLQKAVQEIVASTTRRRPKGEFPFFLIVGAGISCPQIPLASGIESRCREKLTGDGFSVALSLEEKSPLDRYEVLFDRAYPQSEDRQEFLHDLIHKAPISAANFRLAHLLGELQFTNLVFTPNFDAMLSRALHLLGYDVVVCDHPKTTGRVRLVRQDLQVVHVHGTHWFYDCCNLRAEIEGRAGQDIADGLSMGQLLDRVLADRSPIVVGYSGWEGDVIMAALKRRLQQSTLLRNLYWFCFNRSQVDTIPPWVKDHASVRMVLPPAPRPLLDNKRNLEGQLPSERREDESLEDESTLPAREVFEAFIRQLDLRAPLLTSEPLEFFAHHLTRNLSYAEEDEVLDPYLICQALSRIWEGARLESEGRKQGTNTENMELVARVSDAVRRSDYSKAIELAQQMDIPALTKHQRAHLDEALEKVYLGSSPEHGIAACEIRLQLNQASQDVTEVETAGWSPRTAELSFQLASALFNKGVARAQEGRPSDAIEAYEELEKRFGEATDPSLLVWVAKALINKGIILGQDGHVLDEIVAYEEVTRRFGNAAEHALRERVAKALINKGFALKQEGRRNEAVAAYEEVKRRFGEANESILRAWVAKANYELSAIFLDQGHVQDGLIAARSGVDLGGDHYNLACALARVNQLEHAFTELEYSLSAGEISQDFVLQDPDWELLRDHPQFRELTMIRTSN